MNVVEVVTAGNASGVIIGVTEITITIFVAISSTATTTTNTSNVLIEVVVTIATAVCVRSGCEAGWRYRGERGSINSIS